MRPVHLTASTEIDRPAAEAWAVLADYSRDPQWRAGVVEMVANPSGPVRAGTTTRETLRLLGRTWHNLGIVTTVEPGRLIRWHTTDGADAHGARRIEAFGPSRCRVTLELTVTPHGAEHLLRPVLRSVLARNLGRDVEQLRRLLERSAARAAA